MLYGDGTQTRDFMHVSDIVRGLEQVAVHELDAIYNLGTGEAYDFYTVVEMLTTNLVPISGRNTSRTRFQSRCTSTTPAPVP
ncbi:GDP-mannose 4,6 dehydratase [Natrinema hispanicum]|uniref:GDP-mannose 4,6 dehydratase n=1 Tax=Natrinema hispanicum TaxID=392421 RepID=A0A1G6WUN6_9EURY|nr:GDP-mannose 4,6 dehydratase [Natrinema hispanicum]